MSEHPAATPFDYLVSGLDSTSRRVTERVTAHSAAEAMQTLRDKGLTDIKLHTDEVNRFIRVNREAQEQLRRYLSPEEEVSARTINSPVRKFLKLTGKFYLGRGFGAPLALVALALVWHITRTRSFGWLDGIGAIILLSPMAFVLWVTRHSSVHRRVQLAQLRGDWKTIMRLLPRLDRAFRALGEPGRIIATSTYHAKALAIADRKDEAMAIIGGLAGRHDIPADTILCQRAELHAVMGEWESAVSCYRQAAELNPAAFLPHMAIAGLLAVHLRRPLQAREALARAESFAMQDQTKDLLDFTKGAIALEERRNQDAITHFETLLPRLRARSCHTPISLGLAAVTQALASIAYANSGNLPEARRQLKSAAPFLTPHRHLRELLQRAEHAVGTPTGS